MALETLKGRDKIDGFNVWHVDEKEIAEKGKNFKCSESYPIIIDHVNNGIRLKIQNGPIKEGNGVNGCQVDSLVQAASIIITAFDGKFPCSENGVAIDALRIAINAMKMRKERREREGTEGYNKERGDA